MLPGAQVDKASQNTSSFKVGKFGNLCVTALMSGNYLIENLLSEGIGRKMKNGVWKP